MVEFFKANSNALNILNQVSNTNLFDGGLQEGRLQVPVCQVPVVAEELLPLLPGNIVAAVEVAAALHVHAALARHSHALGVGVELARVLQPPVHHLLLRLRLLLPWPARVRRSHALWGVRR